MKFILITLIFVLSTNSYSASKRLFPENQLQIGPNDFQNKDMNEKLFNQIIDKAESIYSPIIQKRGGILKIKRKWRSRTVNAYADRKGKIYSVVMFGGMARHKDLTPDAFRLVLCHELGHHLGGAPKKNEWSSPEGQADYWASLKCLRKVFTLDDNISIVNKMEVKLYAIKLCEENYTNEAEIALCKRISMAGFSLATLFHMASPQNPYPAPLSFENKDPKIVLRTSIDHPEGQCRLDTYFSAALCTVGADITVDDNDSKVGACNRVDGFKIGVRPLCWFRP